MTTFDKREEAFERKYALDEEQKFKAEARRNYEPAAAGEPKALSGPETPAAATPGARP